MTVQLCTFVVEKLHFGIDVLDVQEVLAFNPMTRVPHAPSVVRGLLNLRGQIVTAIDLRARLGLPGSVEAHRMMNVVVRVGEGAVSLLVDEIGDVIEFDEAELLPPPETLTGTARDLVIGVCTHEDRLLLALDIGRTLDLGSSGRGG